MIASLEKLKKVDKVLWNVQMASERMSENYYCGLQKNTNVLFLLLIKLVQVTIWRSCWHWLHQQTVLERLPK